MTVKAIIWTYKPKNDGSCNIKIYANIDGQKKYFKTKLSVDPSQFDSKKGLVKKSHPLYRAYNAQIKNKVLEIESHFVNGGSLRTIHQKKSASFILFLQNFIHDTEDGLTGIEMSTCKTYKSLLTRLQQYCADHHISDLSFNDINLSFYEDFKRYLIGGGICKAPGFDKHVKGIKKIMRLGMDRELHNNTDFQHKLFKRIRVKTNKIYLTDEEIRMIEELDLSEDESLNLEKDRFLISYYFLTRYSDSIRLRRKDFFERNAKHYLRYFQKKTNKECVVPVRE